MKYNLEKNQTIESNGNGTWFFFFWYYPTGINHAMNFARMSDKCSSTVKYSMRMIVQLVKLDMVCEHSLRQSGQRWQVHHHRHCINKHTAEERGDRATHAIVLRIFIINLTLKTLGNEIFNFFSVKEKKKKDITFHISTPRFSGRDFYFISFRWQCYKK